MSPTFFQCYKCVVRRKLTENKFKPGEAKPELLEDWDQRLVVTTLIVDEEGTRLTLDQVAEKDQVISMIVMSPPHAPCSRCSAKTVPSCWRLTPMTRIY